MAVLPALSRFSALGDWGGYRQTLGQGLRMILVLIIPATLGLLVLAEPIVALLFEHGEFTARDTYWTSWALRGYLVGLVFAAVDWPLNYGFYARQDTLTPALVGIFSVGVYLAVALALIQPLGMLGLVLADSAKHISHALTMLVLTRRQVGSLAAQKLGRTLAKALLASVVMVATMSLVLHGLNQFVGSNGLLAGLVTVGVVGAVGLLVYLGLISLLRVEEMGRISDLVQQRLGRSKL
jgi:putative peptidoglycan lipid II flippase